MSPRTGRHRSDSSPSTPLTVLAGSVADGLRVATATGGRHGAVLAVTTGLMATMGVPAASAARSSAADRGMSADIALSQRAPADVLTHPVTATATAAVRFERSAFVVAPSGGHGPGDGRETANAAADIVRTSRGLARAAYKEQQAKAQPAAPSRTQPKTQPKTQPGSGSPGVSTASCSKSRSIVPHLTANARAVYLAVCAAFGGSVSAFGGYRPGDPGDHGSGRAVDIMVSGDPGWAIARYVQAHARELHVTYVIYQQKIWLVGRPTDQWRAMEDRGSRTANHYDHVHVSVS